MEIMEFLDLLSRLNSEIKSFQASLQAPVRLIPSPAPQIDPMFELLSEMIPFLEEPSNIEMLEEGKLKRTIECLADCTIDGVDQDTAQLACKATYFLADGYNQIRLANLRDNDVAKCYFRHAIPALFRIVRRTNSSTLEPMKKDALELLIRSVTDMPEQYYGIIQSSVLRGVLDILEWFCQFGTAVNFFEEDWDLRLHSIDLLGLCIEKLGDALTNVEAFSILRTLMDLLVYPQIYDGSMRLIGLLVESLGSRFQWMMQDSVEYIVEEQFRKDDKPSILAAAKLVTILCEALGDAINLHLGRIMQALFGCLDTNLDKDTLLSIFSCFESIIHAVKGDFQPYVERTLDDMEAAIQHFDNERNPSDGEIEELRDGSERAKNVMIQFTLVED